MGQDTPTGPDLDGLLAQGERHLDAGHFERALETSEQLLAADPRSGPAFQLRALALAELDRPDEAYDAFELALRCDPSNPDLYLDAASFSLHLAGEATAVGLTWAKQGLTLAEERDDALLCFEFHLLLGSALGELGQGDEAVSHLERAISLEPGSVAARAELGIVLFELCRFDRARAELASAHHDHPDDPWCCHYLGLLHERQGDGAAADRMLKRASRLAPSEFPRPVQLSDRDFDREVKAAILRLPDEVRAHLENVAILVQPIPKDEDLLAQVPPLSPTILGMFRGIAVGERSVTSAFDHFPATILLYQRNLERFARTKEELVEQIAITVMHEVGHLIGLDEDDLFERGLD